jgi:hypothetical protein
MMSGNNTSKYGGEPSCTYFDVPVVVDNLTRQVIEEG